MSSTSHHLSTERHSTSRHSTDEDEIDEDVEDEEDVDVEQCSDSEENRDANSQSSKKVIYLNNWDWVRALNLERQIGRFQERQILKAS